MACLRLLRRRLPPVDSVKAGGAQRGGVIGYQSVAGDSGVACDQNVRPCVAPASRVKQGHDRGGMFSRCHGEVFDNQFRDDDAESGQVGLSDAAFATQHLGAQFGQRDG